MGHWNEPPPDPGPPGPDLTDLPPGPGRSELRGRPLRYYLFLVLRSRHLAGGGPMAVAELVERCRVEGIEFRDRPSKAISDALRWEIARGRVERLRPGVYGVGSVPPSTLSFIRRRVRVSLTRIHAEARRGPGQQPDDGRSRLQP